MKNAAEAIMASIRASWMRELPSWNVRMRRLFALAIMVFVVWTSEMPSPYAQSIVDRFPPPPVNAAAAMSDLPIRRDKVAAGMGCGNEIAFLRAAEQNDPSWGTIIGKMLWLLTRHEETGGGAPPTEPTPKRDPNQPNLRDDPEGAPIIHIQKVTPAPTQDCVMEVDYDPNAPEQPPDQNTVNGLMLLKFDKCRNVVLEMKHDEKGKLTHAKFQVSRECMRQQINVVLRNAVVLGQVGTENLPCIDLSIVPPRVFDARPGEWDAALWSITRIFYLHRQNKERNILDDGDGADSTRKHIQEQLMTLDGPLGTPSIGLLQCGNPERSTGSARDRADERSWLDDTLPTVSDLFNWFRNHLELLFFVVVAFQILMLLSTAVGAGAAALAGLVATLGVASLYIRFPETENHRLLIESARYLNNQVIIGDLRNSGDHDDADKYEADNRGIRQHLLEKFQRILQSDFEEYNARPYQRYSINAILNLAQFADDEGLRTGARAVLDYATAKFAVGSSMSRRLPPFRRLMETIRHREDSDQLNPITDGDHLIPYMMFYTGQTQHLNFGLILGALDQMVNVATATLQPNHNPASVETFAGLPLPPLTVIDLAIDHRQRVEQRIKHAGVEIISRGDGWLVTAGGIQAGKSAEAFIQMTLKLPVGIYGRNNDRGAGWPTTLILAAGKQLTNLKQFFRIENIRITHKMGIPENLNPLELQIDAILDKEDVDTFDGNMCVAHGFACGFNLRLPDDLVPPAQDPTCLTPLPEDSRWQLFDSSRCKRYIEALDGALLPSRVFVAVFTQPCPAGATRCDNFGLFEAVSATDPIFNGIEEAAKFAEFQKRIRERNAQRQSEVVAMSSGFLPPGTPMTTVLGTYHTVKDSPSGGPHRIQFSAMLAADANLARSKVISVDGAARREPDDWGLAEGDRTFIRGNGDGRVDIGLPDAGARPPLILDLTNPKAPKRR
jgi:hypothetical protein